MAGSAPQARLSEKILSFFSIRCLIPTKWASPRQKSLMNGCSLRVGTAPIPLRQSRMCLVIDLLILIYACPISFDR